MKPPRLSGSALRTVVRLTDADPVRKVVGALMRKDLAIDEARALPASAREPLPLSPRPWQARRAHPRPSGDLSAPVPARAHAPAGARFTHAYERGTTTPTEVTHRAITEARRLAAIDPFMGPMLYVDEERALRDADASTERWRAGKSLGPLDGLVIPIKEELDLDGQSCRLGTSQPARRDVTDATCVARLRAAGAIILGHTPMTEYGMSPLGVSAQRSLPRNAHSPRHAAGGSSTGSAVAVATGLAPIAIGSDGGGSIRIPASFNGVFGLKPTFGRISRKGDGFGGTMAHVGPIAASTRDLALAMEVTSGEDLGDELTTGNPGFDRGWLESSLRRGVAGLRIGVLDEEIDAASPVIARACRDALRALEHDGAKLVPVSLRLAKHAPAIGYLSIGLETHVALLSQQREAWSTLGPDLQILCRVMSTFASDDYLDAQCLRAGLRRDVAALLREVDVLALPTAACTAPAIDEVELREGMADTTVLNDTCRFAWLGNLTGLPAGSAPVARDERGLPIGLQIVADAWDEATVLQVLAHLERAGVAEVPRPWALAEVLG